MNISDSNPPLYGLAKCCGATPELSTGQHHGFHCKACGLSAFGIGGGIEWLAGLWNVKFHKTSWNKHGEHWSEKTLVYAEAPDLDGWKYARLHYTFHPAWGKRQEREYDFITFKVPDRTDDSLLKSKEGWDCIINDSRCVNRLVLRNLGGLEVDLDIPKFKGVPSLSAFIGRGWCTNNTWWYSVNITTYNQKWHKKMTDDLGKLRFL